MYYVKFEQGRFFIVCAESWTKAVRRVKDKYPELENADLMAVDNLINEIYEI